MRSEATRRQLTVQSGDVSLAGTLWLPAMDVPAAVVLMHPGSGPSDRDNDVFFPPIREHLLDSGFAVASFDKRGVGESTGRWLDAAIFDQADDILACATVLQSDEELRGAPVGLYGHSQGASAVIEAAGRRPPIAFVVPNSGSGVPLAEQERFSVRRHFERAGASSEQIESALRDFAQVVAMMRERMPFDAARRRVDELGLGALYDEFERPLIPEDAALWDHFCALVDYDPRPALERIEVPLLALFGGKDDVTPVAKSVASYRERVRPDLLTVTVFPLGDHRVQVGDPPRPAEGYLETFSAFVTSAVA